MRRKMVIGIAVLALAAFAGGAFAATQERPVNARQAFLSDVAQRLHVSTQQLLSAIKGADVDQLNRAVASGRLTAAQASKMKTRIERGGTLPFLGLLGGQVVGPPRMFPAPFGPMRRAFKLPRGAAAAPPGGFGPPRGAAAAPPGGFGPPRGAIVMAPGGVFGALFGYLGVNPAQLLKGLRGGKTLAQIAGEHGKSIAGLEHAIIASRKAMLDKRVAAKVITRASAAKRLARFEKRLTRVLSTEHPLAALLGSRIAFGFRKARWSVP
jgi:hypothetical protein